MNAADAQPPARPNKNTPHASGPASARDKGKSKHCVCNFGPNGPSKAQARVGSSGQLVRAVPPKSPPLPRRLGVGILSGVASRRYLRDRAAAGPQLLGYDRGLRAPQRPDAQARVGEIQPAHQHPRRAHSDRPGRASQRGRMDEGAPRARQADAAQRLLRAAATAKLPTPQRLPDLRPPPDHRAVPARPPRPAHRDRATDRRGHRPGAANANSR